MINHKGPSLTVDAVISYPGDRVVLIQRGNPPFLGMWALPGGFVEVGETVEEACRREVMEECGIEIEIDSLLGVYSDPLRDPRGHTVGVVFKATPKAGLLVGGDDAALARLFSREELQKIELAFDHGKILVDAGWVG
jgi:8-oxo-dGTP diphosphatase